MSTKSSEGAVAFIGATFRSSWELEALLYLRADKSTWMQPAHLVDALRASDLIVRQSIDSLTTAGLIEVSDQGIRYAPSTGELDELAAETLGLYVRSPAFVRRIIVVHHQRMRRHRAETSR